jgi:DNA-binding HxlR family transcriptional regulator
MDPDREQEALDRAAALVGDRWTLLLVHALLSGPGRFGELQTRITGISPNALTSRLRQLEDDTLVVAEPYQDRPVRHAYRLTDRGRELAGVLRLLAAWSDPGIDPPVHDRCGTPLEVVHWCPTCEQAAEPGEELLSI